MIAVIQRVSHGQVTIAGEAVGAVGLGLVVLLAVERDDGETEARWMAAKLAGLRVFPDATGERAFDRDVREAGGGVLLVSNFTVAAACEKGRRPSLDRAAPPREAEPVFARLAGLLAAQGVVVETGQFGADMVVSLANQGPVTLVIRTPGRSP